MAGPRAEGQRESVEQQSFDVRKSRRTTDTWPSHVLEPVDWRPHLDRFSPIMGSDGRGSDQSGKSGDKGARKGAEARKEEQTAEQGIDSLP